MRLRPKNPGYSSSTLHVRHARLSGLQGGEETRYSRGAAEWHNLCVAKPHGNVAEKDDTKI